MTPEQAVSRSPLFTITPLEIRQMIYGFVLGTSESIIVSHKEINGGNFIHFTFCPENHNDENGICRMPTRSSYYLGCCELETNLLMLSRKVQTETLSYLHAHQSINQGTVFERLVRSLQQLSVIHPAAEVDIPHQLSCARWRSNGSRSRHVAAIGSSSLVA